MISNCKYEREHVCIPIDINQCMKCRTFVFDSEQCSNKDTVLCRLKFDAACPCDNFAHINE